VFIYNLEIETTAVSISKVAVRAQTASLQASPRGCTAFHSRGVVKNSCSPNVASLSQCGFDDVSSCLHTEDGSDNHAVAHLVHFGRKIAGGDTIHSNLFPRQFHCKDSRQLVQTGLGSTIRGLVRPRSSRAHSVGFSHYLGNEESDEVSSEESEDY